MNTLKVGQFNKRDEAAKASVFAVKEYNGHKASGGTYGDQKAQMIIRVYDEGCSDRAIVADYTKFSGQKQHMKILAAGMAPHPDVSKDPSKKTAEEGEIEEARVIVLEAVPISK